jgi:hypothetical protein
VWNATIRKGRISPIPVASIAMSAVANTTNVNAL